LPPYGTIVELKMNYTVDFDITLCQERAIEKWVLRWCRKYHPEAFSEAEKFLKECLNENK